MSISFSYKTNKANFFKKSKKLLNEIGPLIVEVFEYYAIFDDNDLKIRPQFPFFPVTIIIDVTAKLQNIIAFPSYEIPSCSDKLFTSLTD